MQKKHHALSLLPRALLISSALVTASITPVWAGGEKDAVPVRVKQPRYPAEASQRQQEGSVCFNFTVKADGHVDQLRITRSEPAGVFDKEAEAAISKWTFKPKLVDGKAVDSADMNYCMDFKLSG